MSDRIAVMNRGRYEQLGRPEELYERPTTRFVAGFLGVCNLLPGHVDGTADAYALVALDDSTKLRLPLAQVSGSTDVEVGVRPEKVRLLELTDDVPAGANVLRGRVKQTSYTGVSTLYVIERSNGQTFTVYEQNLERAAANSLWRPGEEVAMTWSPDDTFAVRGASTASTADAASGSPSVNETAAS